MEKYAAIAKENLKYNMPIPLVVCSTILILSPLVLGIKNLTQPEAVKVLEFYFVLLGIILFPPVFLAEQNKNIRDLIASRSTAMAVIYVIRIVQALVCVMVLLAGYMAVMQAGNCEFEFLKCYFGTLAGVVFLGGMGILIYGLTDQVIAGYMIPILYYMLCIGAGKEKLGVFYLFSMSIGKGQWKWWLAAAGMVMTAAGTLLRCRRD